MTGTLALRWGLRGLPVARPGEGRVVQWAVQALLPWAISVAHPSVWGLASASTQLLLAGSVLLASRARLRLVARAAALLLVVCTGIDPSDVVGGVAHMVGGGLESTLLVAVVSLLLAARRSRTAQVPGRW